MENVKIERESVISLMVVTSNIYVSSHLRGIVDVCMRKCDDSPVVTQLGLNTCDGLSLQPCAHSASRNTY